MASGSAYLSSLREVKDRQYSDLDWAISTDRTPEGLLQAVADGKFDYTIADSVSIGLMQRIHPSWRWRSILPMTKPSPGTSDRSRMTA